MLTSSKPRTAAVLSHPSRGGRPSLVLLLVLGSVLAGCASSRSGKDSVALELPAGLPQDLTERFEVRDVETTIAPPPTVGATPTATPSDAPAPAPTASASVTGGAASAHSPPAAPPRPSARAVPPPAPTPPKRSGFVIPNRRSTFAADPLWIGERHTFEISYLGMSAGDFTIESLPLKQIGSRRVYHFKGTAMSSPVFSLFYRVNDVIESFMDFEGLFSHRFQMRLDESKQNRTLVELYDSERKRVFFWNRTEHHTSGFKETKEYYKMEPFSQDSLSALMYARLIPLPTGKVFTIPMASEGKNWQAVVTVLEREELQTPLGKMRAVKIKPETKYQGVLKRRGDSYIWLSDDDRRYILKLEARVKIGQVNATLKKLEPGLGPAVVRRD